MLFSLPKFKTLPKLRKPSDSQRGTSMVEFAVILPLVSLLLFGIVQYGIIFNARVTLTDIAAVASRYAVLASNPSPNDVANYAEALVGNSMTGTYLDRPTVSDVVVNGVGGAQRVDLVYRLPTYFRVPGTDNNGRFVIRTHAIMR
jgi:Flp pilus assembly pilin Flp